LVKVVGPFKVEGPFAVKGPEPDILIPPVPTVIKATARFPVIVT